MNPALGPSLRLACIDSVPIQAKPISLTAVYETDEDGWVNAHVVEIPGVNTCARTMDEVSVGRSTVPRHVEIANGTARRICRDIRLDRMEL